MLLGLDAQRGDRVGPHVGRVMVHGHVEGGRCRRRTILAAATTTDRLQRT